MYQIILCLLLQLFTIPVVASAANRIDIGAFSTRDLTGWETKIFEKETKYTVQQIEGTWKLLAISEGSASGLVKKQTIDLKATPFLNWSWKAISTPIVEDEKTKAGDDYVARVYVIFSTGPWFWNTHALNYVWSGNYPLDTSWPNAYTGNAQMLVVRGKEDITERWYSEKRNVREDIARIFDKEIDVIEAIAIMTDSDNSGKNASAAYGDIYFSDN